MNGMSLIPTDLRPLVDFAVRRQEIENKYKNVPLVDVPNSMCVEINEKALEQESQLLENRINKRSNLNTATESVLPVQSSEAEGWSLVVDWVPAPIGALSGSTEVPDLSLDVLYDDLGWLNDQGLLHIPILRSDEPLVEENEMDLDRKEPIDVKSIAAKVKLF